MLALTSSRLVWLALASGLFAAHAEAIQIQYLQQNRSIEASALAENVDFSIVNDMQALSAPSFADFDETASVSATANASMASAFVSQNSVLLSGLVDAQGTVSSQASLTQQGPNLATGDGTSQMAVSFDVMEASIWSIEGILGAAGSGQASVTLTGPNGVLFDNGVFPPTNMGIAGSGLLRPGTYTLLAIADATASAFLGGGVPSAFAEFNFALRIEAQVVPYCTALPNVAGLPGVMDWSGSTSITANDLVVGANFLPVNATALFFYGPNQGQLPFGNGFLCVSGGFARLGSPVIADATGQVSQAVDYNAPPALPGGVFSILPNSTWNFQVWYRDLNPGTALFNTTDALQIAFVP